jgi:hypothetical protein
MPKNKKTKVVEGVDAEVSASRRSEMLSFKVTPTEAAMIRSAAGDTPLSEHLRNVALTDPCLSERVSLLAGRLGTLTDHVAEGERKMIWREAERDARLRLMLNTVIEQQAKIVAGLDAVGRLATTIATAGRGAAGRTG